ncbi:DUF4974 domain-containing protein [Olivibacter sp. LS-1]|uniref:FecR family protein n=1 Tax=Olivibacter sp. LS-1 TaxID=2592345 RepID=UPI0011EAE721|nr:FecR domain-containing protein [Olivibacter sp. LS-1]QEL03024.1 DUF4974 domain-containing protein [Olivibacter sp. LS-1]
MNKDQYNGIPEASTLMGYLAGTLTAEEKQLVEKWANSSVLNQLLLQRMAFIYDARQVEQRLKYTDSHTAFNHLEQRMRGKKRLRIIKRVSIAAAIFIGLVGLGTLFITPSPKATSSTLVTVSAQNHAQTKLTLPDGSQVFLGAGSSISYPALMDQERHVTLHGKGYFSIVPNAKAPFQVKVGDGAMYINVLGTAFSIEENRESQTFQTTLISGSIELAFPEKKIKKRLKPTEKAIYTTEDNNLSITTVNTDRALDWLHNRLVFRKTPMKEVLNRISTFYDVDIEVADSSVEQGTFTGTFENKPLQQVLDYITLASKMTYSFEHATPKTGTKPLIKITKQR